MKICNMRMIVKLADIMVLVMPWIYRPFETYGKNLK